MTPTAQDDRTTAPAVRIRGLSKTYEPSPRWLRLLLRSATDEPVHALRDVDLEVAPGEILAVVGPNGAGKSTLFRVLTGLTTPSSGAATVCGHDCTTDSTSVRRQVGFMPAEERTLFLRYTCHENLLFHGRMHGISDRDINRRIDETLELVGLTAARDRAGFALSSGMKARLQLARALLHEPSVLILDEPTGPVDPISAHEFLTTLQQVASEQKVAVLLSSHRLEEIDALRQSVVLLDGGRVIFRGDLDALRSISEQQRFLIGFDQSVEASSAAELLASLGYQIDDVADDTVLAATDRTAGEILTVLGPHTSHVTSIVEHRLPLRELFVQVLKENGAAATTTPTATHGNNGAAV